MTQYLNCILNSARFVQSMAVLFESWIFTKEFGFVEKQVCCRRNHQPKRRVQQANQPGLFRSSLTGSSETHRGSSGATHLGDFPQMDGNGRFFSHWETATEKMPAILVTK